MYHPNTSSPHQPWPVVLLLQGADVGRANYAGFARKVASYGFVVVVPDHTRVIFGVPGLYADGAEAAWTVAWAAAENARTGSPVKGRLDPGTLLLTGHSFGGAGLGLSTGLSTPPFTDQPVPAPAQLRAAAFYGTNNAVPGSPVIPPVANIIPVALIQGAADGVGSPPPAWAPTPSCRAGRSCTSASPAPTTTASPTGRTRPAPGPTCPRRP